MPGVDMELMDLCAAQYAPEREIFLPQIAALEQQCFSEPWSEAAIRSEFTEPTACFVCAAEGETLLGYGSMRLVCGEGYINNIAVAPSMRRQGIGRALVEELCTRAARQNAAFLTLEVRAGNRAARTLYEQAGFTVVGVRKNFYTAPAEDAVLYTRSFI